MGQKIDFSVKPEGATHYCPVRHRWYKHDGIWFFWLAGIRWESSIDLNHGDIKPEELLPVPAPEPSPAWNGEGLPPVGVACIVTPHNTGWGFSHVGDYLCKVIAYHDDFAWVDLAGVPGVPVATRTDKVSFTTIRTPEQIAADEREKARDEVLNAMAANMALEKNETLWQHRLLVVGEMLDMGYRKQ